MRNSFPTSQKPGWTKPFCLESPWTWLQITQVHQATCHHLNVGRIHGNTNAYLAVNQVVIGELIVNSNGGKNHTGSLTGVSDDPIA
jgi:hypothetical protein